MRDANDEWLYAWGLGQVAFGAASLLVPLYVVALGGGAVVLGILAATAAVVGAPGSIVFGRYADRTGNRRSVVLLALGGCGTMLALLPLLRSVALVVAANAVLWFVSAAAAPVLTMLAVDGAPESDWNRRIALLNKYQGYGWAGGLVLGMLWTGAATGPLGPLGAQRSLFVACAACAGASAVVTARWLPAASETTLDESTSRRIARLLARRRRNVKGATFAFTPNRLYWSTRAIHPNRLAERFTPALAAYFGAALLFFTGFSAFWAPLPLYLTDSGFTSDVVFLLYLVSSLASAALFVAAGELGDRYDLRHLQASALGVRGFAFVSVAFVGTVVAAPRLGLAVVGTLLALVGVTWAVISVSATAIVTRLAAPELRGEVLGVYTALAAVAGGIGSVLGGWLSAESYPLAFAVAGGLVIAGSLLVAVLRGISAAA